MSSGVSINTLEIPGIVDPTMLRMPLMPGISRVSLLTPELSKMRGSALREGEIRVSDTDIYMGFMGQNGILGCEWILLA